VSDEAAFFSPPQAARTINPAVAAATTALRVPFMDSSPCSL
jgi:hypothetical protein